MLPPSTVVFLHSSTVSRRGYSEAASTIRFNMVVGRLASHENTSGRDSAYHIEMYTLKRLHPLRGWSLIEYTSIWLQR